MAAIVLAMLFVLGVAGSTLAVVVVGLEGRGRSRAPKVASRLARAGRHLNGEGSPPRRFPRLLS